MRLSLTILMNGPEPLRWSASTCVGSEVLRLSQAPPFYPLRAVNGCTGRIIQSEERVDS
jgi:hypothetical protein